MVIKIGRKLQLPDIGYTICADDITILESRRTTVQQTKNMQSAAYWVDRLVGENGLRCSPEKL